jgi:hypothetical protein
MAQNTVRQGNAVKTTTASSGARDCPAGAAVSKTPRLFPQFSFPYTAVRRGIADGRIVPVVTPMTNRMADRAPIPGTQPIRMSISVKVSSAKRSVRR